VTYRLWIKSISGGRLGTYVGPVRVARPSTSAWWRVLLTALLLYLLGLAVLAVTRNLHLFPAVVIMGSCAVPVAYVAFFYERRHLSRLTMSAPSIGFYFGGMLSVYVASLLEYSLFRGPDALRAWEGSLIEESVKMACVLLVARRVRHESAVDGMILGAAVGMGFAALESAGYAFTTFFYSQGSLSTTMWVTRQTGGIILTPTLTVTLFRGLLSPMAHGTWTAILAGVLFSASGGGRFRPSAKVIRSFLLVVTLHGLWDTVPSVMGISGLPYAALLFSEAMVGAAGLVVLRWRWRAAVGSDTAPAKMASDSGAAAADVAE
jgi:protease PrsW